MTDQQKNVMRRRTIMTCAAINLLILAALAAGIFDGKPKSLLLFGVLTVTILESITALSASGLRGKIPPVRLEGLGPSQAPIAATVIIAVAFGFSILAILTAMFCL